MDDARYDRLLDLVFDLKSDISEIKEDIAVNTVSLAEHMKRTEMNEARLELNEDRLERLEKRDLMLNGFFKISLGVLAAVSTIIGIVAAIHALL